jgi:N-methylhydantoinase A
VAQPLGLDVEEAASAMLALATEQMVQAIAEITIDRGVDPRGAVLIGGGGAAGLNSVAVMRRLGCKSLIVPETGAALSAVGALMADLSAEFSSAVFTSTDGFDHAAVDAAIEGLEQRCAEFADRVGASESDVELLAEARLSRQVWQLDVPLRRRRFAGEVIAVDELRGDFRRLHEEIFAVRDDYSAVDVVAIRARVTCPVPKTAPRFRTTDSRGPVAATRHAYFPGHGRVEARVCAVHAMEVDQPLEGPAIVESPFSTVVVEPGAAAQRRPSGSLLITATAADGDKEKARVHAAGE